MAEIEVEAGVEAEGEIEGDRENEYENEVEVKRWHMLVDVFTCGSPYFG